MKLACRPPWAGPALEAIKAGKAYYGEVPILGTPYITGYEPIKNSSGAQIASIMWATRSNSPFQ
jgi:hypothetical protein